MELLRRWASRGGAIRTSSSSPPIAAFFFDKDGGGPKGPDMEEMGGAAARRGGEESSCGTARDLDILSRWEGPVRTLSPIAESFVVVDVRGPKGPDLDDDMASDLSISWLWSGLRGTIPIRNPSPSLASFFDDTRSSGAKGPDL
jgi:hypothetical protein